MSYPLPGASVADADDAFDRSGDDSAPCRRLQDATSALKERFPELSAASGTWLWQRVIFAGVAAVLMASWMLPIGAVRPAVTWFLTVTFVCIIAIRCLVLWTIVRPGRRLKGNDTRLNDEELPRYTVLVAVYRETEVAGQLIRSMARLDYPVCRLQILFATEEHDTLTQAALLRAGLSPNMQLVVVPDGQPRTKPRALNFAMSFATGDYVVVFDAEDEPEPDQLRKAIAAFRNGPANLGCLQAELKIHNADRCWLTRQFAIEYAALFGLILPAFERFGLPITLGGTSNHFLRRALDEVGRWDPFNVTEDADLGLRLARRGWRVGMLQSATWEEAPENYRDWHNQRIRWLKGWLQTAIVHTRQPWRLWRDLGPVRFFAVHVMLASMLLSAFVHPVYVAALIHGVVTTASAGGALGGDHWWMSGLVVFLTGYAVSLIVALVAARRSDHTALARHVLVMPAYWLLISAAAYAALYEYGVRPFHWNKTPHGGRASPVVSGTPVEEVANQL